MIECLRALDRSAHQPHVIQLRPGPLEAVLAEIGVEVHVLREHRVREVHRVVSAIAQIGGLVRERGFRFLPSNGFRAHVHGGLSAAIAGVPGVRSRHTLGNPGGSTYAILAIPPDCVLANFPRRGLGGIAGRELRHDASGSRGGHWSCSGRGPSSGSADHCVRRSRAGSHYSGWSNGLAGSSWRPGSADPGVGGRAGSTR
jgi:hypothetical protein